jgi:predicted ATPase/serine/threonine protein kinase
VTATGRRFGHYTLLGKLGAGGMGEVSLARDDRLGREVALKMLPRRLAQDAESLMRFRREALTLASLNHPNIAVIHGFEEDESGALALVLERVEGETLGDRLHRGALPPNDALQICVQIAEALEVAHERGIIHRDLKPGNVMLAPRGLVKVLDFGLARRITDQPSGAGLPAPPAAVVGDDAETIVIPAPRPPADAPALDADTIAIPGPDAADLSDTVAMPAPPAADASDTIAMPARGSDAASLAPTVAATPTGSGVGHTTFGEVTGTPGYMSPEQVRGEGQDHRTDVFAFGCVLFECLTGARAIPGQTVIELLKQALDHPVDLSTLPDRTPTAVRDLLGRCLERDASLRLAEIRTARHTLEDVLGIRRAAALRAGEAAAIPNNLPAAVTSFVGRERELADCARQLESTRWLTLVGMGGSGKTRLARRLAEQALEAFPDGVWFVDLTALKHQERVPESLADAAGIQEEPGVPILKTLLASFAERRVLIVLDNCEELLDPVSHLGLALLEGCPGLKLLATSREPTGSPGEVVVPVAPLGLPAEGGDADPGVLAANESVRLFVERAVAASPAFTLGAQNAGAVAEICRRLDGIPLAIELAAARARTLPVEQLAARLDDRFRLLTGGSRAAAPRHRTLRAAIAWSDALLEADERELFVRLGAFAGAWSLTSAVALAGADRDEFEVLDAMTRLVDRSLVVVTPSVAGETRYRYLETVRQFALDRLVETGEEPALRARHLDYFLGVAEESQAALAGAEQKQWLARLDVEHNDLLAAHAWCGVGDGHAVQGLRLVGALWRFWAVRGHYAMAGRALTEALARPGAAGRSEARATALVSAAGCALARGDYGGARPLVEEALAITRELEDRKGTARCLTALATIAIFQGLLEEAEAMSTESLVIYRDLGRTRGVAHALHTLGHVALSRGRLDEAHTRYEGALQALAGTGDDRQIAHTLTDFARVATRQGDWEAAQLRFATALQILRGLGVRREAVYALEGIAELAFGKDQPAFCAETLGAAQAIRETIGSPLTPAEASDQAALHHRVSDLLGESACAESIAAGRALGFEAALDLALRWLEVGPESEAVGRERPPGAAATQIP